MLKTTHATTVATETPGEELAKLLRLQEGIAACANDENIDARINKLIDMIETRDALLALPGINAKTANAVIEADYQPINLDDLSDAALDGIEEFETDGFDITGQAASPDYRPDSEFEFATNQ